MEFAHRKKEGEREEKKEGWKANRSKPRTRDLDSTRHRT